MTRPPKHCKRAEFGCITPDACSCLGVCCAPGLWHMEGRDYTRVEEDVDTDDSLDEDGAMV